MDKRTWGFVLAGLAVAAGLAVCVAPFASSAPDGLDKFAHDQKFEERAEGREAWKHALLPDYKVGGVANAAVATGLAGLTGTVLVFGCAFGLAKVLRRKDRSDS